MVAIVSGNSLGLGQTSLATLGQHGLIGTATHGRNGQAAYVNIATGNLVVQNRDDFLVAAGTDIATWRTYNSRGLATDDNGDNWGLSLARPPLQLTGTVNTDGSTVTRTAGDGAVAFYAYDASSRDYVSREGDGAHDRIAFANGRFAWTDGATNATESYEGSGVLRLRASLDAMGKGFTYAYDAGGRLVRASAESGDSTFFVYDTLGLLAEVRSGASLAASRPGVRYQYDGEQRLRSVIVDLTPANATDAVEYRTDYGYDGTSNRVTSIAQTDQSRLQIAYLQVGAEHRVAGITDAMGRSTSFSYRAAAAGVPAATLVTDGLGQVTRFDHDSEGQLLKVTPPAGAGGAVSFTYSQGNVASVRDGAGAVTTFAYDERGNRTLDVDALNNRVERSYNRQNRLLSEKAGDALTRHVHDAATGKLLRFTISAAGQVTEHLYDAAGREIAKLAYARVPYLASESTEADLAAWALAQAPAAVQLASMAYDARGQLASLSANGRSETFVHDQRGQLLERRSAAGRTLHAYDGLGRVLASTELGDMATASDDQVTTTVYLDATRTTRVTLASGLVATQVHDKSGLRVATINSAGTAGETRYVYDAAGRLRMTEDPTQVRNWMLYDAAGRKVADIDGNGTLTESVYNAQGLLAYQARYATAVDTSVLFTGGQLQLDATLADLRPAVTANDARQWWAYDAGQRLVRQAATVGTGGKVAVTDMRYDEASRLERTTAYASLVTAPATATAAIGSPATVPASDRVTRYFHDADGRRTGELDAEGYLTTTVHDAAGRLTRQVAYAKVTATDLRAEASLAELLVKLATAQDIGTVTLHDDKGRTIGQVDAEGYLTETTYDAAGNVAGTIRYATKAKAAVRPDSTLENLRPGDHPEDRVTSRTYDAFGRLKTETNADGLVTVSTYDNLGRLVATVRDAASTTARKALVRYDLQGRLVGELAGEAAALVTSGMTQEAVDAIWAGHGLTHSYDAAGRRLSTIDAQGNRTLFFHDADGALTHTVNALGEVRENRYDAQGRLVEEIAYAGRVSLSGLAGGLAQGTLQARLAAIADADADSRVRHGYTASGALASQTDALGAGTTHGYNAFGDRVRTAAAGHAVEAFTVDRRGLRTTTEWSVAGVNPVTAAVYDAFGRAVETVDANGNLRTFSYDRLGRQVATRDPLDKKRTTTYDAFDRVLTQTNALGKVTSYTYDRDLRSIRVTTPEGVETTSVLNAFGEVRQRVDGNGNSATSSYDRDGRLLRTTTALATDSNVYDRAGRLVSTTDGGGVKVAYGYDAANRLVTRTVDPAGLGLVTTYRYDGRGQRIAVTDPNGVVTVTAFDGAGQVLTQTVDAAGLKLKTSYTYDEAGRVLTVRSPGGSVTQSVYDLHGRRVREVVDPDGLALRRSWTYDDNGNAVTSTDARGNVTRYAYDAADRLVYTVDPLGNVRVNRYDAEGRINLTKSYAIPVAEVASLGASPDVAAIAARVTRSASRDLAEYRLLDDDGRVLATVDGAGGVTRFWYDAEGNVIVRKSYANRIDMGDWDERSALPDVDADAARDQRQQTVYDALGRAVYLVDITGAVVEQSYDATGNLLARVAYAERVSVGTTVTQEQMKQAVKAVADPSRDRLERYAYDAANRLVWTVDAVGAVTRRFYDDNGNLVRQVAYVDTVGSSSAASVVPGADDRIISKAYDAANRLVLEVDAMNAVTQHVVDADGRVVRRIAYATPLAKTPALGASAATVEAAVKENEDLDRQTRYAYDAAGRGIYEVGALGAVTFTGYDGTGNVVARTRYAQPISARVKPTEDAIGAAVEATAADRRETFSYNAAGHLLKAKDAMGGVESWSRDAFGRKLAYVNQEGATWTYDYDAQGRLLGETSPKVNLASVVRDAGGALTAGKTRFDAVVTRFAYDGLGNLVQRNEAAGRPEERITRYRYDHAGRQIRVDLPEVGVYDPGKDDLFKSNAAVAARVEVVDSKMHTLTVYDALGNAVAGRDLGGSVSQKAYDKQGRVAYEIDALGYVTGYKRNAFGEVVRLVRYGDGITVPASVSSAATIETVEAALALRTHDHSADRTLLSTYDRTGRLVETREPTAYVYTHSLSTEGSGVLAACTTRQVYDAFGQVVQVVTPRGVGEASAITTRYYDRAGRETGTVDALGYLTLRAFDGAGNLLKSTEYATAIAKGWTPADYGDKPAVSAEDRTTTFTWDLLDRMATQTRVAVQYSSKSNGTSTTGNLTTSYAYDGLGRQTAVKDASGAVTYTYHDALGRIQAIAAPKRAVGKYEPTPLTLFDRDAHGNAVGVTLGYAAGASVATASGYEPVSHADDRHSFTAYDSHGRAVQTTDAAGNSKFVSYDRLGNVAKQWQGVTSNGVVGTAFEVNVHDKLGRVLRTVTPDSRWVYASKQITHVSQKDAGLVTVSTQYNAFGEMTARGDTFFDYDAAGRLWRTNSGDGVVRIMLFDLQGNVTSEIRTSGSGRLDQDLSTVASAAAADNLRYTRRTDMTYDALGRVTAREEGARRERQGGVTVDRQLLEAESLVSAAFTPIDDQLVSWRTPNKVVLSWSDLSGLGSGDVKVTLEYLSQVREVTWTETEGGKTYGSTTTVGGVARKYSSEAISSSSAATGVKLEWAETAPIQDMGGISEITRVLVHKKDVEGVWRIVMDQELGYSGNVVDIDAPPNPDTAIALEMRVAGTAGDDGWFTVGTRDFGAARRFDADALGPGKYGYRVQVKTPGEGWHLTSSGVISLTAPPLNAISAGLGFGKAAAGTFSWKAPAATVSQDFRYREVGSTGIWRSLPIATDKAGLQLADTRSLADGDYQFELLWTRTDHGIPTSHATGSFTVGKKPAGAIDSKPGKTAISTSEGGKVSQAVEQDGEQRWLRPMIYQASDRWGNVVSVTDPRSKSWKTTYAFNASNQLVRQTLAAVSGAGDATTQTFYDQVGRQVAVKDARGHVNGQVWDAGGNLVQERRADGAVFEHQYNVFGNRVSTEDALGKTQSFSYDDLGRMTAMAKGTANIYSVDAKDNKTLSAVRGQVVDRWTYDELGRRTSSTNGEGDTIAYIYDLRGNLVQTRQPMGRVSSAAYDAQGRKLAEVDANGSYKTWTYDAFGRELAHRDLGGQDWVSSYDHAKQLITRTSDDRGQALTYDYDAVGQLTKIVDTANKKTTYFGYDLAGRKVREKTVQRSTVYQDNFLSYDAQGRLRDVADGRVHVALDYDAVGNRSRIATRVNYQGLTKEVTTSSVRFFQYDEMNRQTVVDGLDADGSIGAEQGHQITYDANGNRKTDVSYRNRITTSQPTIASQNENGEVTYFKGKIDFKQSFGKSTETYAYDNLDRLTSVIRDGVQVDVRRYDGADRVIRSGPFAVLPDYMAALNQGDDPSETHSQDVRINRYDGGGRLLHQRIESSDGKQLKTDISWDPTEKANASYVANGYDKVGNVLGYVVQNHAGGSITEYTTTLAKAEGYQALATAVRASTGKSGAVTHAYDANGFLVGVDDATQSGNDRVLVNDADGRALYVRQGDNVRRQLIVDGEVMGTYGVGVDPREPSGGRNSTPNFADHADFNFGYAPVSASHPAPSPGAYQVKAAETLQSIAQAAYGESALWYRIAEANGKTSNDDLRVGETITIPNRVGTVGNSSTTFQPYDASRIVGDTTPNLPAPSSGGGCGAVGTVLMVVVAVVVTIYTAGVLTPMLGGVASAGGTFATGLAAIATPSVAGVLGAAAGSAAGQLVGVATGNVREFSWQSVALSAISAGIGPAIAPTASMTQPVATVLGHMGANAVTQGVALATGLQKSFSWRQVAASGAGALAGAAAGEAVGASLAGSGWSDAAQAFARRFSSSAAAGTVAGLVGGNRVTMQGVAVDAFGNALGQSLTTQVETLGSDAPEAARQRQLGSGTYLVKQTDAEIGPQLVSTAKPDGLLQMNDIGRVVKDWDPQDQQTHSESASLLRSAAEGRLLVSNLKVGGPVKPVPGAEGDALIEGFNTTVRETRGGLSRASMYRDLGVSGRFAELDQMSQRVVLAAMAGYADALNQSLIAGGLDERTADAAVRYASDAAKQSGAIPEWLRFGSDARMGALAGIGMLQMPVRRQYEVRNDAVVSGETAATVTGKAYHSQRAAERRASGDYDMVNEPFVDAGGRPIQISRRVDLRTGEPVRESGMQMARPDSVVFRREVVIDDKPMGRPVTKDQQEIMRFVRAYEAQLGAPPRTVAIERYDPLTMKPVMTELYKPSDFPWKK